MWTLLRQLIKYLSRYRTLVQYWPRCCVAQQETQDYFKEFSASWKKKDSVS
jgi:hypothetical protein